MLIAVLIATHLARQYWTERWVGAPLLEWITLGLALLGIGLRTTASSDRQR